MAVYTQLNQNKIEEILSNYNLGKLDSFKGIEEGIENTNYFLSVNKKKLILLFYIIYWYIFDSKNIWSIWHRLSHIHSYNIFI